MFFCALFKGRGMLMAIIGLVLAAIGIALIIMTRQMKKKSAELKMQLDDFTRNSSIVTATVLDVHNEAITLPNGKTKTAKALIIQFRIEEQKKTVVHRCTEKFYKDYKRGDALTVHFREGMSEDTAVICGDNRYERIPQTAEKLRLPCIFGGSIMIISGIVMMIISVTG